MRQRAVRLAIVVGICALLFGALALKNTGLPRLKSLFGGPLPGAFVGKWVVDTVDGKPVGGDGRPVLTLGDDGSVQVDLAGHEELADDLQEPWLKKHLVDYAPGNLGPGAKVTGSQIPRKANPERRISLRRMK